MTSGQELAVWQLREIAVADPRCLEIENVKEPTHEKPLLWVTVSVLIGAIPRASGGLPLRERETFYLAIPPQFPLNKPEVWVAHARFAGKPHVQWVHHLCLYQAASEWNPSDGMFGLLDRLDFWLQKGALDQLDPAGEPIHPPAVYADVTTGKPFIPKQNTPSFEGPSWLGLARITDLPNHVEITGWFDLEAISADDNYALALLFGSPLPWEYPTKGADLFREVERQGVPKELIFKILRAASTLTAQNQPIYVILGAPMRGTAGGERKQHLSIWAIDADMADQIRLTLSKSGDTTEIAKIREEFERLLVNVLQDTKISWCRVLEARPEVTIRRDADSHLSYFRGRSVSIWGCGALGAPIAIHLGRAGVHRLVLRDNAIVTPGILVRQPYFDADVCTAKVFALKDQLLKIRPDIEVEALCSDLGTLLSAPGQAWSDGSDMVIDATASDLVRRRLEMRWHSTNEGRVPVASLMLDRSATCLIAAVVGADYSGGTWDAFRKTKLEILRDPSLGVFAESFFPAEIKERPFQPEPGCSEPTFMGSSADSAALAGIGLNLIAKQVSTLPSNSAISNLFAQPLASKSQTSLPAAFELTADFVLTVGDHKVRIGTSALREIGAWISQNRRLRNENVETGGLLWGEWDDATGVVWVTDASGPPPDSRHSESHFLCGVRGTREEHESRVRLTRRSVGYIGMWHTHPTSSPFPSETDFLGMHEILTAGELPPRKNLLLILGKHMNHDTVGGFLFRRMNGDASSAVHYLMRGQKRLPEGIL